MEQSATLAEATPAVTTATTGLLLKKAWENIRQEEPRLRIRDAAQRLGVSEAELLATGCGTTVTRLAGDWGSLIEKLEGLGYVMALTRNNNAVHEKKGNYKNTTIREGGSGMVLDKGIDLRLFLNNWRYGFAVQEETERDARRSLQFFAPDGTAVHKIYLQPESDLGYYQQLVTEYRSDDQSTEQRVEPAPSPAVERPDSEVDTEALLDQWKSMKDTHQFVRILRRMNVGRLQALRLAGDDLAFQVENSSAGIAFRQAAEEGIPIMIFVGNPGVVQIHVGNINRIVPTPGWLNILDPEFNLHLRDTAITSSWVVRKPTDDGVVSSLELFDAEGNTIALMFGSRKESKTELPEWRALAEGLPRV